LPSKNEVHEMTVIYEVNLNVEQNIEDEFARWLGKHVAEMISLPGFVGAELAREERKDREPAAFSVRYRLENRAALEHYFAEHAERMRGDGVQRFGRQFSATRRILHPVQQ
jgi:quinol monooxygenase YgiN